MNNDTLTTTGLLTKDILLTDDLKNCDKEKIISMMILGVGSLICGLIPAKCDRNSSRCPLVVSLMLCFGAGILLATALVHMLPDVRKVMPNNAELTLCGGFFMIYFVDEFIHYFFGEAIQHSHESSDNRNNHHNNYGTSNNSETQSLLAEQQHAPSNCNSEELNSRICHIVHNEPCTDSMTGTIGLLCALSLHSLIEGLAIGVQNSGSRVFFLLAAVSAHKFVMAFCLGLEFCSSSRSTFKSQIIAISVFSLGSVLGIGLGMAFVDLPETWSKNALPILQALAGGTLLYVTVSEVLPREKARWHQSRRKIVGLVQFLAVSVGFSVMTLIDFYLDDN